MATEWEIAEAMVQYGGGFVSQLGKLFRAADVDNKKRLVAAFPDYFDQYREIAQRKVEREYKAVAESK